MANRLRIAKSAPHTKSSWTTRSMMIHFIIALLPTIIVGINFFGINALNVLIVCVCSCFLFEMIFDIVLSKEKMITDFSSILIGFLLALVLPATTPIWLCVLASGIAIVILKELFGGIGKNKINPVAGTKLILILIFGSILPIAKNVPIMSLAECSFQDLLIGWKSGCIGEICIIAILLGGLYLIALKIIDWKIPVISLVSTFFIILCFNGFSFEVSLIQLLSGGIMFSCVFLAADFASSPQTSLGRIIYSVILGLLIALFRMFGVFNEGAVLAIVLMNLVAPLLDKLVLKIKYEKIK